MPYQSTPEDRNRAYILGVIYVVLAVLLAIMLFKIWPPVPWPEPTSHEDGSLAALIAVTGCPVPSPSPEPSPDVPKQADATGSTPTGSNATQPGSQTTTAPAIPAGQTGGPPGGQAATAPAAGTTTSQSGARAGAQASTETTSSDAQTNNETGITTDRSGEIVAIPINLFGKCVQTTFDERLILLVIIAGMLGAFVHGATSLADYIGNNCFNKTWTWFYLLRPAIGMALALVFYFVIRGGFLTTSGGAKDINPYGIAALAGLVGMFSKQATDKLGEVFGTLFRSAEGQGDDKRDGPLKAKPTTISIGSVEPPEVVAGTTGNSIKLTGTNFDEGSTVWLDDKPQETTFESANSVVANLANELTAAPGVFKLKVVNSNDDESASVEFTVIPGSQRSAAGEVVTERAVHGEGGSDELIDGCDVELKAETGDDELPITEGGVR